MTSSHLNESARPIHRYAINPKDKKSQDDYASILTKGIQNAFVGPMPPAQFILKFLPQKEDSSAFKPDMFSEVAELFIEGDKKKAENKMYEPFVRIFIIISARNSFTELVCNT